MIQIGCEDNEHQSGNRLRLPDCKYDTKLRKISLIRKSDSPHQIVSDIVYFSVCIKEPS